LQLLAQGPARDFEHRQQLGPFGRPQTLDALECRRLGVQQPCQPTEGVEHVLRQAQHPFAPQSAAQQQRQQLGVAERARAARKQLFTRAGIWR
jgi:hypothetical protein